MVTLQNLLGRLWDGRLEDVTPAGAGSVIRVFYTKRLSKPIVGMSIFDGFAKPNEQGAAEACAE